MMILKQVLICVALLGLAFVVTPAKNMEKSITQMEASYQGFPPPCPPICSTPIRPPTGRK